MSNVQDVLLPDIGDFDAVEVIEVLVSPGDAVAVDDSLLTLESDKATMEIPSPQAGTVVELKVQVGDKVGQGDLILTLDAADAEATVEAPPPKQVTQEQAPAPVEPPPATAPVAHAAPAPGEKRPSPPPVHEPVADEGGKPHASPSVRRFARELGVVLDQVRGNGPKGRIRKQDVQAFVKASLADGAAAAPSVAGGALPSIPAVDFSRFGEVETRPLNRIKKISGPHLHRAWLNVPHVTQFDEADITDQEAFRKSLADEAKAQGVRLTPLVFLMKAVVASLRVFPDVNASLDPSGQNLILKKYFHIGVAVDTPDGLMVPVIRDVDQKSLFELAAEVADTAGRARDGKLTGADLQGGCFSISSLGGIGGTQFTPIVNAPEVAILGVSRAQMKPVYQPDGSFQPRLILPLALSYDHRVIDGAMGVRFTSHLGRLLSDIRRLLL